eukprot:365554-Chlamydomonas_euryale.AAC.21
MTQQSNGCASSSGGCDASEDHATSGCCSVHAALGHPDPHPCRTMQYSHVPCHILLEYDGWGVRLRRHTLLENQRR